MATYYCLRFSELSCTFMVQANFSLLCFQPTPPSHGHIVSSVILDLLSQLAHFLLLPHLSGLVL